MMLSRCRILLAPVSFLYGLVVRLRNLLFDSKCLRSETYPVPVICVGNLAVGGTGKTPHIEYLVRLLKDTYKVAVLSRGYRRKTSGFVLADKRSTGRAIGDEPCQMKRKFPDILVAVDANRREGIERLLSLPKDVRPEVILLDDAFQHRYVKPSLAIVLTDYHQPFYKDRLLPLGRLREPTGGVKRADMVVVTKCEDGMTPAECRAMEGDIKHQMVYFSRIVYADIRPVFAAYAKPLSLHKIRKEDELLALAGIASPDGFIKEARKMSDKVTPVIFPDHHDFGKSDIRRINEVFLRMRPEGRYILVTEKDAARLVDNSLVPEEWKACMYCLPITVAFSPDSNFDNEIRKHITTFPKRGRDKQKI